MSVIAATYPDVGGVKRAIKSLLLSDLAAQLTALMAAYQDGLPLPAPDPAAVYTSEKATVASYPTIEIIADRNLRMNADERVDDYRHQIVIFVTALDDDEEQVTAKVERYVLALRQTLQAASYLTLVSGQAELILGNEDFTPVGRRGTQGPFLKTGSLEVSVPTFA